MDLGPLRDGLAASGWLELAPGQHLGMDFDLVGNRRFNIMAWTVLVKAVPHFGVAEAAQWRGAFQELTDGSKRLGLGKSFLLCLVAESVDPAVVRSVSGDSFSLKDAFKLKTGGGDMILGDVQTGQVYGDAPAVPVDAHGLVLAAISMLQQALPQMGGQAIAELHCVQCGQPLRSGAKFCDACGAKVAS